MSTLPTVELIAFPGAPNLPIFAALEQGLFEKAAQSVGFERDRGIADSCSRTIARSGQHAPQFAGPPFEETGDGTHAYLSPCLRSLKFSALAWSTGDNQELAP